MGGKTSTSTSQVSIPPEVLARYNAVNTRAEDVATNPFKQYGTTADAFVAPVNQQQTTGIANVNAAAGTAQPYINVATGATVAGMGAVNPGGLDIGKYMNPYQQQVIDTTMKQMGQANEQAQSGALGTAVSSGAFGGDRAGIAAANLANQQGMAMGSTLAGLNAQNYGQAVQTAQQQQGVTLGADQANMARLMSGAGQIANLGTTAQQAGLQGAEAQINAGTLQQQTEQAGKTALVNQFMQEQGYPFQVAQFLANIAMGTGSLSGSTTTTTQPAPFFSDRRLKEDVKRIGNTDDGLPIYKFKYKGDDSHQTHVGFMADEVEQKKPEAVGLHPSGYKTVDYDKATRNSMGGGVMPERAGQGFAEGGVAGPYGSSPGSQVDFGGYVPQAYLPVGDLMMADPNVTNAMRQSFAEQLAAAASMGEKLQSMESTWDWAKNKWGSDEERDAAREAESARGVAYASGGAAYLKTPSGGLVPNSDKTYLTDTIESQNRAEKPELMTAQGGGSDRKSPAENIANLAKIGLSIFGIPLPFRDGGRAGYQVGGSPEEETMGEKISRLTYPARDTLLRKMPLGALSLGAGVPAATSGGIGLGAAALGFPTAGDLMLDTSKTLFDYQNRISREANAPARPYGSEPPREMTPQDMREMERAASEGRATIAGAPSNMTMAPPRYQGDTRDPLQPVPRAGLGLDTEYGQMLRDPSAFLPPERNVPEGGIVPTAAPSTAPTVDGGLVPAAGTPLAPSGGLIPAAGTPLAPSGGLIPAAGTPFPTGQAEQTVSAPTVSTTSAEAPAVTEPGLSSARVNLVQDGAAQDGERQPTDPVDFFRNNILKQESGHKQFDSEGRPLTSSAGAVGIAQVMEGTGPEAAALAGLPWDRDRWLYDADYNAQIGEAYFMEQYRKFGSLDLAAAAYNAGPGAVSKALRKAETSGGSYLNYLPAETQNYVKSTTGYGGSSGVYGGQSGGLGRAVLTSDRPYEDRSMVGKMFYDEKGNLNRNAIMSAISGIGAMLSSPSQFFLPSLGLGLQGFAGTYAGLEKQAADVGLTRAQEDETRVRTDVSRFFTVGAGGMPMVVLGPGRSVTLDQYLSNPQMFSTGNPQQDAQILAEARNRSSQPATGGASSGAVFQSPVVQDYIQGEASAANMNYAGAQERSAEMYAGMEGSAEAARASRASLMLQTDAVANLVSPNEVVRSGALGQLRVQAVRWANELLRLGGYEEISGADDAQIAEKAAIAASLDRASGGGQQSFEALNALLVANPNVQNEPEANAKLMSTLMLAQQRAVDMAEFAREYRNDPSNQYKLVTEAPKAFDDVYRRRYLAEEQALKTVILHGYEKPEGWPKSPMEYLMDQSLSAADRNEVIRKTLLSYGYTEDQIAPLTSSGGAIDMARYFGG